jgi:hypothetical protein
LICHAVYIQLLVDTGPRDRDSANNGVSLNGECDINESDHNEEHFSRDLDLLSSCDGPMPVLSHYLPGTMEEHTSNLDFTAEPTLFDLHDSINPVPKDTTPIDCDLETGTLSRPVHSVKDTFTPKRPRNAFIIFRSEMSKDVKGLKSIEKDNRHISHMVSHLWNDLSEDQRAVYHRMAKEEKVAHQRLYPNYRFAPKPREKPVVRRNVKRATKAHLERSEKIAKMYSDGLSGDALKQAVKELDETCPIIEDPEEVQLPAGV